MNISRTIRVATETLVSILKGAGLTGLATRVEETSSEEVEYMAHEATWDDPADWDCFCVTCTQWEINMANYDDGSVCIDLLVYEATSTMLLDEEDYPVDYLTGEVEIEMSEENSRTLAHAVAKHLVNNS